MLAEIDRAILIYGYWSGEVRRLRDAIGRKRLGPSGAELLSAALVAEGFEVDGESMSYESSSVVVRRRGAGALAETIADLLPSIRVADAAVPSNAMWRDSVVATLAVRAWRPARGARRGE